jgi:uncharacterized RDD family membrane protein YckC
VFCSKCGSNVQDGTAFCPQCGQPTGTLASPSLARPASTAAPVAGGLPPAANYPAGVYSSGVPAAYAVALPYAGFWIRFVAYLIDALIMGVLFIALFVPFAALTGLTAALGKVSAGDEEVKNMIGGAFILGLFCIGIIAFLAGWLYHAKMESSSWQATLGKRAVNLKVTDLTGNPITFQRATGRYFAKIITGLIPLAIGYIMAAFTERRQAVHDMIASTLVLRRGVSL